jgi:DNA topoisomerase-1
MEELGIGRPSTYAPTISTIQQRGYVERGSKEGVKRSYDVLKLKDNKITETTKSEMTGNEKAKLLPTDVGIVVNDFLMDYFPNIMDYNFTASVEKEFDEVAEGKKEWNGMMDVFYQDFHPLVEQTMNTKTEHRVGERILGIDPDSGKPVSVKIGRYGPIIQIGSAEDEEKPRFAQLAKGLTIETITLEEALDAFKLPRNLGEFEEKTVAVGVGRFGPYVRHNNAFVSIPKGTDPMTL